MAQFPIWFTEGIMHKPVFVWAIYFHRNLKCYSSGFPFASGLHAGHMSLSIAGYIGAPASCTMLASGSFLSFGLLAFMTNGFQNGNEIQNSM